MQKINQWQNYSKYSKLPSTSTDILEFSKLLLSLRRKSKNSTIMTKTEYHIFVENDKLGLKDAMDRITLFAVYDGIIYTDANTPVCICRDGKWGLANVKGRLIVDSKYDNMAHPQNERIAVCSEKKWGFIDFKGKEIIPLIYDDVCQFVNAEYCFGTPNAWVVKDGKWGTINSMGEVIIPFEYDNAEEYNGNAIVEKDKKSGVVNSKNEFLVPLGDNAISFLDYDIVSFSGDEMCGAINLLTKERYEYDYDIDEYSFNDGFAVVEKSEKMNVIDKNFNVILPEWHDEIELLENGKILLLDEGKCALYDTASGISEECKQDDSYVYLPDGKTVYYKNRVDDTVYVKAGIENLAYLAHNKDDLYFVKYQQIYDLKTLKFDEGVTTIGTGWEELELTSSIYDPQVDIYLPSTLKEVNPKAFSDMVEIIRDIYVPFGMGDTMRSILPPHLRPFVKEGSKGLAKVFDGVKRKGESNDPISLLGRLRKKLPKTIQKYFGFIFFFLFVPFYGFMFSEDAVLPVDSIFWPSLIGIAIISAVIAFAVTDKDKVPFRYYKRFLTCMCGWALTLFTILGTILFIFFGANNYFGGEEPKYGLGEVIKQGEPGKGSKIKVLEFDKTIYKSLSYKYPHSICVVKYHKGLFGIYVIDGAK